MSNKLKKGVDKMKKAGKAIEGMKKKPEIEENKDEEEGRNGYNQLIDENSGERVNSMLGDEENQLLDEVDEDTLLKDLDENDPLVIEHKNLKKAKKDLDAYIAKRSAHKAKPSPQEEAMKASLQKKLLTQQIKFKEEQKKAQIIKREIQKMEMAENGQETSKNIILPQYELNNDLKVYEEINIPPSSLYKAVGYNDMQRVKIIVEGDDSDKRSELARQETLKKSKTQKN